MKSILNRFKIPTVLGLGMIVAGIIAGVFLVLQEQNFLSKASPNVTPQNITISNISDNLVTISWQTATSTPSFLIYGQASPDEVTILDDKDLKNPKAHLLHYFTLKNLLPKTTYQYKIISGKISSDVNKFTTASPLSSQLGYQPIIGSILDGDKPLEEGIVYLSATDSTIQSAQVKSGNFLIPISQIRKTDLSDSFSLTENTIAKLTVVSEKGSLNALIKLTPTSNPLPPLKLGQDIDLTSEIITSPTPFPQDLIKYDLNNDGKINAADNSIILDNFGKNPKNKSADLNSDKVVDQKDLDLMSKQINQ